MNTPVRQTSLSDEQWPRAVIFDLDVVSSNRRETRADPAIVSVTRALRGQDVMIGLVAHGPDDSSELSEAVLQLGAVNAALHVRTPAASPDSTPSTSVFDRTSDTLGLSPGECIYVSEKETHCRAAILRGWRAVQYHGDGHIHGVLAALTGTHRAL